MWYFGLHCLLPKIKKICISFWVASENNSKRQAQVSKAPCLGNLIQEFFYAAIIHGIREGTEAPSLWTPLREHATQNPFCTPNPSCFRLLSLLCLGTTGGCRTQGLYFVKYHDWAPEEGFRDSRLEESFASPIRWSNEIKENTVHLRKLTFVVYRDVTAGFGAQEAHTVSPHHSQGTCSVHRPQRCHTSSQSSCWINKTEPPQRAAPQTAMPLQVFHPWFLPPENVSDSQQRGLTEQPKHSRLVISTNWEED